MNDIDLAATWAALAGTGDAAQAALTDLLQRWAEPHRRYHNVDHLAAVITTVDELLPVEPKADGRTVRLAAWFHDAVYDPRRGDNEEQSAALARASLPELGIAADVVDRVAALVVMTKTHEPRELAGQIGADGRVLADADLAVLALPEEKYDAYVGAVRAEYAFVSEDAWRTGRGVVLDGLLARRPLYYTPPMQSLESCARASMARELTSLR